MWGGSDAGRWRDEWRACTGYKPTVRLGVRSLFDQLVILTLDGLVCDIATIDLFIPL